MLTEKTGERTPEEGQVFLAIIIHVLIPHLYVPNYVLLGTRSEIV
jgi:hypothetical protein